MNGFTNNIDMKIFYYELAAIKKKINNMPRKLLNFLTPYEAFFNNYVALENWMWLLVY